MVDMHRAMSGPPEEFDSAVQALAEEDERFWTDLSRESDRGLALVAGAYFDNLLSRCLQGYFLNCKSARELLSSSGALGTFSARLKCVRALRIMDESDLRRLGLISRIRNRFAHELMTDFTSPAIGNLIQELETETAKIDGGAEQMKVLNPRQKFEIAAWNLSLDLQRREFEVRVHTREYEDIIPYSIRDFMRKMRSETNDEPIG